MPLNVIDGEREELQCRPARLPRGWVWRTAAAFGALLLVAGCKGGDEPADIREQAKALDSGASERRVAAARTLARMAAQVVMVDGMRDHARVEALRESAVPALERGLADVNVAVRVECAAALAALGPIGAAAAPSLVARLRGDTEIEVRRHAAHALAFHDRGGAAVAEPLGVALDDDDDQIRSAASRGLSHMGDVGLAELDKGLRSSKASTREAAIIGLRGAGAAAVGPRVAELSALVASDLAPGVRGAAAWALAVAGVAGGDAIPALSRALRDDDQAVRLRAAQAISKIGDPQGRSVSSLSLALARDASLDVRAMAAEALGLIGSPAGAAADALIRALGDESAVVRERAAEAVGRLALKRAEDSLRRLSDDPDDRVRRAARSALDGLGAK